jgi:hypothetical protein
MNMGREKQISGGNDRKNGNGKGDTGMGVAFGL